MVEPLKQFWVYRLFAKSDELLYVGYTRNPAQRMAYHETHQPWWASVASKTFAAFGSEGEARGAECAAIRTEDPLHNIQFKVRPSVAKRDASRRGKLKTYWALPGEEEELYEAVKAKAQSEGRTVADVIWAAFREYVD